MSMLPVSTGLLSQVTLWFRWTDPKGTSKSQSYTLALTTMNGKIFEQFPFQMEEGLATEMTMETVLAGTGSYKLAYSYITV